MLFDTPRTDQQVSDDEQDPGEGVQAGIDGG